MWRSAPQSYSVMAIAALAPQRIAAAMLSVTNERWAILAILNVFFLIIGMFLAVLALMSPHAGGAPSTRSTYGSGGARFLELVERVGGVNLAW